MPNTQHDDRLAFTVMWEVRDGEAEAAADIITRFAPEARKEPGLELLMVNQCATNPSQFLFYEVFADEAAFGSDGGLDVIFEEEPVCSNESD